MAVNLLNYYASSK